MVVSMTAVGPVGVTGALAWLVVLGASGSASEEGAGGGWVCGVGDWGGRRGRRGLRLGQGRATAEGQGKCEKTKRHA